MGETEPPSSSWRYIFRLGKAWILSKELHCRRLTKPRLRFNLISGSSLLKWLNSLYRPAGPEEIRGKGVLQHSGRAIGASPSGKAVDFDSTIRRFESSRPSQAVTQLKIVGRQIQEVPANWGFSELYVLLYTPKLNNLSAKLPIVSRTKRPWRSRAKHPNNPSVVWRS
jgi:hypothetical protein